jgi:hypothetical protein
MDAGEQKIIHAYLYKKLSCVQVARQLGHTVGHVYWVLSKHKIRKRSISDAIRYLNITKFDKKPFLLRTKLKEKDRVLKIAGVMLYWGEGSKRGSTVALSNSDPIMVKVFVKFLRRICGVDESRLRVGLHYYKDQDPTALVDFWAKTTRIPKNQFDKPYLHHRRVGSYKTRSLYGTVAIRYSDKRLLDIINCWINDYQEILLQKLS